MVFSLVFTIPGVQLQIFERVSKLLEILFKKLHRFYDYIEFHFYTFASEKGREKFSIRSGVTKA